MIFWTHLAFGLLLGIIYINDAVLAAAPAFILATILAGSVLPDIDLATSKVGKYFRPFNSVFEHRQFFHSVMFMIVCSISLAYITQNSNYAVALIIGFSSHIFLDSLTKGGIYVFWPAKLDLHGKFKTGGLFDMLLFVIFVVAIFLSLKMYGYTTIGLLLANY